MKIPPFCRNLGIFYHIFGGLHRFCWEKDEMERVRRGRRRRKKYPTGFLCPNHSDKPLKAKIVSAMASTIFESYLHWTNMESGGIFFLLLLTFSEKTAALGSGCLGNVEFKHLCNWRFINGFCIGGVLCWEILRQWIACSLIFVNFIV